MEAVLEKLKSYMKEKNMSIYKVTELSELSENTIYNWYNKGAEPSVRALQSICKVLDVSMSELFCGEGEYVFTNKEFELLKRFSRLSDRQQDLIFELVDALK